MGDVSGPGPCLLSSYEIIRELGRGGEGIVYLVRSRDGGERELAAKVRPGLTEEEREILNRLAEHPVAGLVHVRGLMEEPDGRSVILMDIVRGDTLQNRLQRGPGGEEDCLRTGKEIVRILLSLHRTLPDCIYTDLKPSNLLAASHTLTLLDPDALCLCSSCGENSGGTPGYAAPEQYGPHPVLTERSEIYSVGAVLAALRTQGRLPPLASSGEKQAALASCSPSFRRVLDRCLREAPKDRYRSLKSLYAAFAAAQIRRDLSRFRRRSWAGVLLFILFFLPAGRRAALTVRIDSIEREVVSFESREGSDWEDLEQLDRLEKTVGNMRERYPSSGRIRKLRIRLLRDLSRFYEDADMSRAIVWGQRLAEELPANERFDEEFHLAGAAVRRGSRRQAETCLSHLISTYPEEPEAWLLLASWQYSQGLVKKAETSFKRASALPGAEDCSNYHSLKMKLKAAGHT